MLDITIDWTGGLGNPNLRPDNTTLNYPNRNLELMTTRNNETDASEHLQKLEALFGGTTSVAATINRRPVVREQRQQFSNPRKSLGRAPSEFRLRLERLRMARTEEEIQVAADAFLEHHQLPDDIEILIKVLLHPSEKVLREAMGQISALLMQGRLNSTVLVEDRLKTMEARVTESSTISYISGLQQQINKLKN